MVGKKTVGSAQECSIFADIVPCWDDALFKQNFRASQATFINLLAQQVAGFFGDE